MRTMKRLFLFFLFALPVGAQTITQDLTNQTVTAPQTATFTVTVSGGPCHSAFYVNGGLHFGPVGSTISYSIPSTDPNYRSGTTVYVKIYGCTLAGSSLSSTVTLTVNTAPPAPLINAKINTGLFWCTKCDNSASDNVPMTGNLVISQQGTTSSFGINADGTVSVNLAINLAVDPADFIFYLTDANGVAQPGQLEWVLPRATVQSAAGFMLGTLNLPGIKLLKTVDATGNPLIVFKGFTTP